MAVPPRSNPRIFRTYLAAASLAIAIGALHAAAWWWTNDDANISFRYADHLIRGLGLVFNPGERVEGYTNFLWTLWCALGMRLGIPVETWANASGLACFAATIACLAALAWSRRGATSLPLPIAALGLALHRDAAIFATGGLETSLFMLLITAGCTTLVLGVPSMRRSAAGGALLALAVLTRPDGAIPAALAGVWLLWDARLRPRVVAAYAVSLALIVAPWLAWKLAYYGELLPNTYYAKSAHLAWWSQGVHYVGLFFMKYTVLAVGLAAGLVALVVGARRHGVSTAADGRAGAGEERAARRQVALALLVGAGFVVYVARVGGDFMFARFLVPVTPLMLVALEIGIERLVPAGGHRVAVAALALVLLAAGRDPLHGKSGRRGIMNEREWYPAEKRRAMRRAAESFAEVSRGLPLRVAFHGAQAILAYHSRVPVAIESEAGLTDRFVARQPLATRGRVGHEKSAPLSYLVDERRAHFTLADLGADSLAHHIPVVRGTVGELPVMVLDWEPAILETLIRRGAAFDDFPARLDSTIRRLPEMSDSAVAAEYVKLRRFYFRFAADSAREAPFRRRLRDGAATASSRSTR